MSLSRMIRRIEISYCMALVVSGSGWTARKANAQGVAGERQQEKAGQTVEGPVLESGAARYYSFKNLAESGVRRGEEMYNFKCNMCHNKYTNQVAPVAPLLEGLYKRPKLLAGDPVNDQTVTEKIKNGGPGMPAYRHTLSDKDLEDLVRYLREGCCPDPENPPSNPRFRKSQ